MAILLGLAPWSVGSLMLYTLLYRPKQWHIGHHLILIGCGAYVGYLMLALVMYQLQGRNLSVFSEWLAAWAIILILACWVLGTIARKKTNFTIAKTPEFSTACKPEPEWLIWVLCTWLVTVASFVIWEVAYRPAVSWDAIAYWTTHAPRFLNWQLSDPTEAGVRLSYRHGATIHLLHSWSGYVQYVSGSAHFLYMPWLALHIGLIITAVGFGWAFTGNLAVGLSAGVLLSSSSVGGGQAVLAGYADIWLAAGLFLAVALTGLSAVTSRFWLVSTWIGIALSLIFLKSAGIGYTILLLLAALAAFLVSQTRTYLMLIGGCILAVGCIYAISAGFDITLFDSRVAYIPETRQFYVGHYSGVYADVVWGTILSNMAFALVSSSSYLLAGLSTAVIVVMALCNWQHWRQFGPALSLFVLIGLLTYGALAQAVSNYFLMYSGPDQDTGLTRFSQGWFLVCIISLVYLALPYLRFFRTKKH